MAERSIGGRLSHLVHGRLPLLIVAAYGLAAACPWAGERLRSASFDLGSAAGLRIPPLLLGLLLFNAGLASDVRELTTVLLRPRLILAGVFASAVVPLALVAALAAPLDCWHDSAEAHSLLLGLGLVAAMPVAGSSTAWSQNAGGSAALSLGLVVASTVISPLTTPLALALVEPLAASVPGGANHEWLSPILLWSVVAPSLAGMAVRLLLRRDLAAPSRHSLKLTNSLILLTLCYINASGTLPSVLSHPDWDFLAIVVATSLVLCGGGFAAGWMVGRCIRAASAQRRSLAFALGMSNNGTGLVIAGSSLAGSPDAVLAVLVYNLVQHVVASAVNQRMNRDR